MIPPVIDSRDEIVKTLLMGLTTDGSHHKQWALDKALRLLCTDQWVTAAECEFQWDKGIAP